MLKGNACQTSLAKWRNARRRRGNGGNDVKAIRSYLLMIGISAFAVTGALAQLPPPAVVPPVPNLNPSSSLVLPQSPPVPVSPGLGGGGSAFLPHSYHSGCSVFRHGPCFPHYLPPIGQDLRLTIVSTDESDDHGQSGSYGRGRPLS